MIFSQKENKKATNLCVKNKTERLMLPAHFHDVTYDHIW